MSLTADVAIAGAGIAGLGVAWRLAQAGLRVTVIDHQEVTARASWASAGMLAPDAEFGGGPDPLALAGHAARARWAAFADGLEAASGVRVGFLACGALRLADDATRAEQLIAEAGARSDGAAFVSGPALAALQPGLAPRLAGALHLPGDGLVNNRALLEALAQACRLAGVHLLTTARAARLVLAAGRVAGLSTGDTDVAAAAVVIAAGAWSGRVAGVPPEARVDVRPVKGQMAALAPGAHALQRVLWTGDAYLVGRPGLAPAAGATVEETGFDTTLDPAATDALAAAFVRRAPGVVGPAMDRWCGFRPMAPDGLPVLGASVLAGLFYATGQYRNGVLLAPLVAEGVASDVLGCGLPAPLVPFRATRPGLAPADREVRA